MTVQQLHSAIVAEIDRRLAVIAKNEEFSPAPWEALFYDCQTWLFDAKGRPVHQEDMSEHRSNRIAQAVNSEAPMLAFMRAQADAAMTMMGECEIGASGPAKSYLEAIAAALGLEVDNA